MLNKGNENIFRVAKLTNTLSYPDKEYFNENFEFYLYLIYAKQHNKACRTSIKVEFATHFGFTNIKLYEKSKVYINEFELTHESTRFDLKFV